MVGISLSAHIIIAIAIVVAIVSLILQIRSVSRLTKTDLFFAKHTLGSSRKGSERIECIQI